MNISKNNSKWFILGLIGGQIIDPFLIIFLFCVFTSIVWVYFGLNRGLEPVAAFKKLMKKYYELVTKHITFVE